MTRSENMLRINKKKAETSFWDLYDLISLHFYTGRYRLKNGDWNKSEISRALKMDVKTVRKHLPSVLDDLSTSPMYQDDSDKFEDEFENDPLFKKYCEMMRKNEKLDGREEIILKTNEQFQQSLSSSNSTSKIKHQKTNKTINNRKKNKEAKKQRKRNKRRK